MKGLPTFDSSSDGHESGIAVPSAGASNLASHEGFGDPGLPGEWGHAEPRWEDSPWDFGWGMVQVIQCVPEKGHICIRKVLLWGWVLPTDRSWRLDAWWHFSASSAWLVLSWPIDTVTESRHALGNGKERLWKGTNSYTKLCEVKHELGTLRSCIAPSSG